MPSSFITYIGASSWSELTSFRHSATSALLESNDVNVASVSLYLWFASPKEYADSVVGARV